MEGARPQEEAARASTLKDRLRAFMGPIGVFSGILFSVQTCFLWLGLATAVHWLPVMYLNVNHEQGDFFFSMLWGLGLTALILVAVYMILPVRRDQLRDALVQAAGLLMVVYPFMVVTATYQWSPAYTYRWPVTVTLGMATPYWLIYYIIGALFLVQPLLRADDQPSEEPHSVQNALEFCLALLTTLSTLVLMFLNVLTELYIAVLIATSLVVVVFTGMYAIHPKAAEIKRVPLL